MEPKDIDYRKMALGEKTRLPRGVIVNCPCCEQNGLLVVYSWRRGKYDVSIWHTGVKDYPGYAPLVGDSCNFKGREKDDVRKVSKLVIEFLS